MAEASSIKTRILAVLVLVAALVTIAFNVLATMGLINGVLTNTVSDKYPTVITPAGWAFSIWSLIYIGILAFSVYQLLPATSQRLDRLRAPFLASCVLNCTWIWVWHHEMILASVIVIAAFLVVLLWLNARISAPSNIVESVLTKGVFGLYCGWLTAATLVNFVLYLVYAEVDVSRAAWNTIGISCLVIAVAAAFVVRARLRNFVYPLAVAWASAGIGAKQSGNTAVVVAAALTCVACLILAGSVVTTLRDSTSESR